jgi:hypothetical protein
MLTHADRFGFKKVIVVITSPGVVAGIHSGIHCFISTLRRHTLRYTLRHTLMYTLLYLYAQQAYTTIDTLTQPH